MPGPRSYTGEDCAELQVHGGPAVVDRLTVVLTELGLRLAEPGEFTRRAFEAGRLDLAQAEAVGDLIDAETDAQARQALAQLGGALGRRYEAWRSVLIEALAMLEAAVDFPDEELPEDVALAARAPLLVLEAELRAALADARRGQRVRDGFRVAIIGAPNAGKSTLLNGLVRRDQAIVTATPGTTRDVIESPLVLAGYRVLLADTAGVRETTDAIEAEGIRRSWKKLEEAGLILAVFDGSEPLTREDLALAQRCAGRPAIALVNKEDKPTQFDAEIIAGDFAMVLPVCCQEEGSRRVIAAAVARLLGTNNIDPHAASLSGQRQLAAATRARDAVAGALDAVSGGFGLDAVSVCVDDALDALCDLTGENASENVINEVFERFCVGK